MVGVSTGSSASLTRPRVFEYGYIVFVYSSPIDGRKERLIEVDAHSESDNINDTREIPLVRILPN
jgi:hypothetical protein